MLKKSCLALAAVAAALTTTSAMAAILSLDYAGNVQGHALNGTATWDSTSTGTAVVPSSVPMGRFSLSGLTLFVDNVDYSSSLSNAVIELIQWSNAQEFAIRAAISGPTPIPDANSLYMYLMTFQNDLFSNAMALPSSPQGFAGAAFSNLGIYVGSSFKNASPLTFSATEQTPQSTVPPITPSVPEPGTLLLVALAGLALGATRRRSTTL